MSVLALITGAADLGTSVYAAKLVGSVANAVAARDYSLMLYLEHDEPGNALDGMLRDRIVEGAVIRSVLAGQPWVEALFDADLPTVLIGDHPNRNDVPTIDTESTESSAQLVGHLLDTGCQRVGIITGPLARIDAQERLEGYRRAHHRRDLPVDDQLVVPGDFEYQLGYSGAMELLSQAADGIYASNDEAAGGVLAALRERNVSVPDDVSVVGFDGTNSFGLAGAELTTMVQPFEQLAEAAVESLMALLAGKSVEMVQQIAPVMRQGTTSRSPLDIA